MTFAEFPLLQRTQTILPFLVAALALFLVILLPWLPLFAVRAVAGAVFAALVFNGLFVVGFPTIHVLAITLLSVIQAGAFESLTNKGGSIWLALAVYCVASATANFVQHRDARRVMALGAALSLVQLLDPMGAVLAVCLLPVCVGLPRAGEIGNKAGLLAILLFMPVVTAMVLAYARGVLGLNPMAFARAGVERVLAPHTPLFLLLLAGFTAAPVLWLIILVRDLRSAPGLIAVYTGLCVVVAVALAYLLGAERDMASVLTASAAVSAAALCTWRRVARHADLALAATALAAVVSWLLINLPSVAV
jgi:hypothetical protein